MKRIWLGLSLLAFASIASAQTSAFVHAGTPAYTDSQHTVWAPDTGLFNNVPTALSGCSPVATVQGTTVPFSDAGLYKQSRWSASKAPNPELTYTVPLTNGTYTVTMFFAETCPTYNGIGKRVFSVISQGVTVLPNVDPFANAGGLNIGVAKTFQSTVTSGKLVISFLHVVDNPMFYAFSATAIPPPKPPAPDIVIGTISVTVTATGLSHSVGLSWTPSTSIGVNSYNVYRSTATGGPYNKIGSVNIPLVNYTDPSVTPGATYFYTVTAINPAAVPMESDKSNQAIANVPLP